MFDYLSGKDAQAFVDVIDEASIYILSPLKIGRSVPTKTSAPCLAGVGKLGYPPKRDP